MTPVWRRIKYTWTTLYNLYEFAVVTTWSLRELQCSFKKYDGQLSALLLHLLQVIRNIKLRSGLLLHFLDLHTRSQFGKRQLALFSIHLEDTLRMKSAHYIRN